MPRSINDATKADGDGAETLAMMHECVSGRTSLSPFRLLITEERDPKREPVLSQGFPGRQLFRTSGIFTFDSTFVLRNDRTCVSSGAQVIWALVSWALGTKALSLHSGIYFCPLVFQIRTETMAAAKETTENAARFCSSCFTLPLPAPHRKPRNT